MSCRGRVRGLGSALALCLLVAAPFAPAAVIVGEAGLVNVTETLNADGGGFYSLEVFGTTAVAAFGVSNPDTTNAFAEQPDWVGRVITETEWDSNIALVGELDTLDLGSFASLFGSDGRVNFYSTEVDTAVVTTANDQQNNFVFSAPPASTFIALDFDGNVIDGGSSSTSALAEPATLAIVALGVLAFGFARRPAARFEPGR